MKSLAGALFVLVLAGSGLGQGNEDLQAERRIVQYLKQNVKPGETVVVSDLNKNVFKSDAEKRVLDRLFNTFFKIPLFVAQYKASTNEIPKLEDISRQFNLRVEGEASVLLSIIDSDPRVPKFLKRDEKSGEIVSVDIEMVKKDRRFGQILERTLLGWLGKDAPAFELDLIEGATLKSPDLQGKNLLVYFWFSGCPPCVRIAPHLVELQKKYGDKNFTVIGVNADKFLELEKTDAERAAYIKKAGFTFPVGHLSKKIQQDYGNINVYPTLFLVDSRRVIQKHYVNYQPLKTLSDDVRSLIEKTP